MSIVRVDDGDSNLFTNGGWIQQQYGPRAFQGTISWASEVGATKVVRFVGTSIGVLGALQPIKGTANQPLVIQFSIDGGAPQTYAPAPTNDFEYVSYYQSSQLPIGEHVLTMVNMVGNDICLLDGFVIQANGGTAQILRSNGSPTPSKSAPPPPPVTAPPSGGNPPASSPNPPASNAPPVTVTVQPSSNSSPTSNQPSSSNNASRSSSSSGSNPPSSSNSNAASSNPNTPNVNNGSSTFSASIYNPTTINANGPNGQADKESSSKTPVIIAVVTSVLLVLIIVGIVFLLVRRRRKKGQASIDASSNSLLVNPYPPNSPGAVMSQLSYPQPDKVSTIPTFDTTPSAYRAAYQSGTATISTTSSAHLSGLEPQQIEAIGRDEKRRSYTRDCPAQRPVSEAGLPPYVA